MPDKKLNVLIFGGSMLSSSIIEKLNESPAAGNIYTISSGNNPLLEKYKKRINLGKGSEIRNIECKRLIKEKDIDFAIMSGETYSYSGLIDYYKQALPVIGVTKKWFKLEAIKSAGRNFMIENGIKTPSFFVIKEKKDIDNALKEFNLPIVIKNNFLQAGFGTYICTTKREYKKIAMRLLKKHNICIAEKFIKGEEITQTYIWDTKNLIALNPVRDYKKLKAGNRGINTGGMGSYTPVNLTVLQQKQLDLYNQQMKLIFETVRPDFTGIFCTNVLFSGDDLYTLEFNMRPGITEFKTLLENMDIDVLDFFCKIAAGKAKDINIKYKKGTSGCVVVVHKDYYKQLQNRIKRISLKKLFTNKNETVKIYLNGGNFDEYYNTNIKTDKVILALLNTSETNPFEDIYRFINTLDTKNLYYRKDIGA